MALDLNNTNSQNTKKPTTSTPVVGNAAATKTGEALNNVKSSTAGPGTVNNSQTNTGKTETIPSHMSMRPPRFWLVLALLVIAIAVAVGAFYLNNSKRRATGASDATSQEQKQAASSKTEPGPSPIAGASPVILPKVDDQKDISLLNSYFKKASTNFREEFMAMVPKGAVAEYKNYLSSSGDAQVQAAQSFYIYLANPANLANAQFKTFLADVKGDLEKTLGKPLFE